jgi:hypothetical protein
MCGSSYLDTGHMEERLYIVLTDKLMLLARVQSSSKRLQHRSNQCVTTQSERSGTVCDTLSSMTSDLISGSML